MKNPGGALSQANVEALHKAILAKCDALDGVKDGLIGDPTKCHFDPSCCSAKARNPTAALRAAQVETVKIVFADVKTKKGEIIWTGFEPGGELQYAALKSTPTQPGGGWDSIRILGHQDADYDFHKFDLDTDVALADKSGIDAHTYDLSRVQETRWQAAAVSRLGRSRHPAGQHRQFLQRSAEHHGHRIRAIGCACS